MMDKSNKKMKTESNRDLGCKLFTVTGDIGGESPFQNVYQRVEENV